MSRGVEYFKATNVNTLRGHFLDWLVYKFPFLRIQEFYIGQASDSETFPLFFHLAENYELALESLVAVAATRNKHDNNFL